jgi:hypothetical protein
MHTQHDSVAIRNTNRTRINANYIATLLIPSAAKWISTYEVVLGYI